MAKAIVEANTLTMAIFCYQNVWLRKSSGDAKVLQKSTDGSSWSNVYTFDKSIHSAIITENGTYIVSVDDDVWTGSGGELWRSDDDGGTFTKVLDMETGAAIYWSLATKGNNVIAGEYAQYPATKVWLSKDDGETWTNTFTNPVTEGNVHVHKVAIDPDNENYMLISYGDDEAAQGIWYTVDAGDNWTKVSTVQITSCEYIDDYIYLFTDNGTGDIYRDLKSNFENNTVSLEKVFDGNAESFQSQVYASTQDEYGRLYAGYIDEDNASYDNPGILVSGDGTTWERLYVITKTPGTSRGVYHLSRAKDGIIFAASALNPVKITYFDDVSTVTLKGNIS